MANDKQPQVVGLRPWLPWPLCDWPWWTEPVRAERLAALRIGVAVVLLWDVLSTYLPHAYDFFGQDSLGSPEIFVAPANSLRWSLLRGIGNPVALSTILVVWAVAALFLLMGVLPRLSAVVAWALSVSIIGVNGYLHNSGDNVRTIELFYLIFCPSAAVWSLRSWQTRDAGQRSNPVYVQAWPLRLLFVQLMVIYFFNGVYKLLGPHWREGNMLYHILCNLAWTRFSYAHMPLPYPVIHVLTWTTLFFELTFPVLVMMPRIRTLVLWIGVGFHVGTCVSLQLGPFPLYMICMYLPLVPWERYLLLLNYSQTRTQLQQVD